MKWALGLLGLALVGAGLFIGPRLYDAFSLLGEGDQIDVGGRNIFLHCEGDGSPTVLLEHGLGSNGHGWQRVQGELAGDTRVCWTTRAGVGFSDAAPGTAMRTAQDAADDLHVALTSADIVDSLVLVGHSFGGFVVRLYVEQHPDDVDAVVLVDSTHERQVTLMREQLSADAWADVEPLYAGDNPERMDLIVSAAQVAATRGLGARPLVVLEAPASTTDATAAGIGSETADEVDALMRTLWPELQRDLADLSSVGVHREVIGTGHFIHEEKPEVVVAAIREVMASTRNQLE